VALTTIVCSGNDTNFSSVLTAPNLKLSLYENENHTPGSILNLSRDLINQPIIINFWYPSCPPCREEIGNIESAYIKYKDQGLMVIGVQSLILDSVEDGQQFVDEFGITYAVGADIKSTIQIKYEVIGFPTTFFLNREHKIVRKWSGLLDNNQLDIFISEILN